MLGARYIAGCVLLGANCVFAAAPVLSHAQFGTNRFEFRLSGEAGQAYIIQASRDLTNWSGVLTNVLESNARVFDFPATNASESFRVKVATPLFNHAVFTYVFDPGSYPVTSDSFDSADPRFSTAGQYDAAKRRDGGDVASYTGMDIGNSQIAGKVWTGAEATVALGASGAIGSLGWVDSGQNGIEPGYWRTNLQEGLPAIGLPQMSPFAPVGGIVEGEHYTYVFGDGDFALPSLRMSTGKLLVAGKSRLYLRASSWLLSNVVVRFKSPYSNLHVYLAAPDAQFHAQVQGIVKAKQFIIFGLTTCVSIDLNVPTFTGVICAPNALCTLTTSSFVGACTARAVRLNGRVSFHFDGNLKRVGTYYY